MTGASEDVPAWATEIKNWRQGDYTLDVSQIVLAEDVEGEDLIPVGVPVVGLIVISQTCDVVICSEGREWITVAALIEVDDQLLEHAEKGTTPSLVPISIA